MLLLPLPLPLIVSIVRVRPFRVIRCPWPAQGEVVFEVEACAAAQEEVGAVAPDFDHSIVGGVGWDFSGDTTAHYLLTAPTFQLPNEFTIEFWMCVALHGGVGGGGCCWWWAWWWWSCGGDGWDGGQGVGWLAVAAAADGAEEDGDDDGDEDNDDDDGGWCV